MHAEIEFVKDWFAEVQEKDSIGRLRQAAFRKGTRLRAKVLPIAGGDGLVHLHLTDGSTALQVPLSCFALVGQTARAA
jgi:hypothetical protein